MTNQRAVKVINRIEELGVTRKELAEAIGVTERAVYRWLSYESEPRLTVHQFANFCEVLKWSPRELADAYMPAEYPTDPT